MPLIEVEGLKKSFGALHAVRGIGFTLDRGEVLGFLGPNGAGKSTTMKMLAGFLAPSAGRASICGHDVVEAPLAAKRRMGYLPEGAPAYPDMTPQGFLRFVAGMRGFSGTAARARVDQAVERVDLERVLHQPIETLSKGFKRRVGLAQALLHDPEVLILDEPTDGLDPNQKHQIRSLIQAMAADKAIIVSTHILEEVDAVCTRAMVIGRGRILADGTPHELEARSRHHRAIFVRTAFPLPPQASAAIAALASVAEIEPGSRPDDNAMTVFPAGDADPAPELRRILDRHGALVLEMRLERGRLEAVFRDITTAEET